MLPAQPDTLLQKKGGKSLKTRYSILSIFAAGN